MLLLCDELIQNILSRVSQALSNLRVFTCKIPTMPNLTETFARKPPHPVKGTQTERVLHDFEEYKPAGGGDCVFTAGNFGLSKRVGFDIFSPPLSVCDCIRLTAFQL